MKKNFSKIIAKIPQKPGVYRFYNKDDYILYIGKALRLKDRVKSYFTKGLKLQPHIQAMIPQIEKIKWIITDSEIEALLLEAEMIKRYKTRYNKDLRDDKSYLYIAISKEEYPRILYIRRSKLIDKSNLYFGPYPKSGNLKQAMRYLRKIFPYRICGKIPHKPCLWYQMYQTSAPCDLSMPQAEYRKIINQLKQFLRGGKKKIIQNLQREMKSKVSEKKFEDAAKIRDRLQALQHLHNAMLSSDVSKGLGKIPKRIECFDISNISGKFATGSLVVFENGKTAKDQYRRFKIRYTNQISDVAMLAEVIKRRFRHPEWAFPEVIVIDGGVAQLNVARKIILEQTNLNIPIIAVAKGPTRKGKKMFFAGPHILSDEKLILSIRDEAHRFAISYHKLLRSKGMFVED